MDWSQILHILFLIGRIIVGGYFLMAGLNHFANVKMMAGYAKSKGTPGAEAAVVGTGILLVLGERAFSWVFTPRSARPF